MTHLVIATHAHLADALRDAAGMLLGDVQGVSAVNFVPLRISRLGEEAGFVTGYYEPLLRGSRQRTKVYAQPVRGVPDDLLTIDLGTVFPELKDKRVRQALALTLDRKKIVAGPQITTRGWVHEAESGDLLGDLGNQRDIGVDEDEVEPTRVEDRRRRGRGREPRRTRAPRAAVPGCHRPGFVDPQRRCDLRRAVVTGVHR